MATGQSLSDQIAALWASAQTRWQDEIAQYFYQDYIVRLQESAQHADSLSRTLTEELRSLTEDLTALEAALYE